MPITGIFTARRHSYTMRTAIGRIAGPLSPPTMFDSLGRRVSTSIAMARNVLTSETASAPASSDARANEATSVTFGVSLGITGRRVTFLTALTTSKVPFRLQPNVMPPSLMFGQEMFSSSAATPSASDRIRASSTYSSSVLPQMLTMTVARRSRSSGSFSLMNRWTPMPWRPMALSIPAGVSTIRSGGCPCALAEEETLDRHAAEQRQVDDAGVFDAVAEAAAGRDDRVGERQRADLDGEIHVNSRLPIPNSHVRGPISSGSRESVIGRYRVSPRRSRRRQRPARRCTIGRSGGLRARCARGSRSCSTRPGRIPSRARPTPATAGRTRGDVRHRFEHRLRTAGVDHDVAPIGARRSSRSSGTVTRPRSPTLPSSVASTSRTPRVANQSR